MSIKSLWLFCLLVYTNCQVEKCSANQNELFVSFHPHFDAFWLNSDEELKNISFKPALFLYKMNQRSSKTVLNSMLQALTGNESRKYFITEIVFFKDWYDYLNAEQREQVKKLINSEQLEITNSGWVENDEAVCYYDDVLDQYTLGMKFMSDAFSKQIKIAWATDSFGHSHSQAALEHLLGFEFQAVERVDERYINYYNNGSLLQFYWQPISDSNNRTYGGVLNLIRHFLHEVNDYRKGRTRATQTQKIIKNIINDFELLYPHMRKMYKSPKLFRFLGNDFEQFISQEFQNFESALTELNEKYRTQECSVFKYGNPTDYLSSNTQFYARSQVPTRKYDFLPHWDQDRYWSGYYTTDPQLKKACKDFSRLMNLYRKILLIVKKQLSREQLSQLTKFEELLAVMQHHDGITATSKTYIENNFKKRMNINTTTISTHINQLLNLSTPTITICQLYRHNNKCKIPEMTLQSNQKVILGIFTLGNVKSIKIELQLFQNQLFEVENDKSDIFCQETDKCVLVYQTILFPGFNKLVLKSVPSSEMQGRIIRYENQDQLKYQETNCIIYVHQKNKVSYEFEGDQYINFEFVTSANTGATRNTTSWTKYGKSTRKMQRISSGAYIMFNNGIIKQLTHMYKTMKVGSGHQFIKVKLESQVLSFEITIPRLNPNLIEIDFEFKPPSLKKEDYFLKVESAVKSSTFYHDSNGYLVAKRMVNSRPDYEFSVNQSDIINANTYPVTSFAYLLENDKKFVFSSDRAQGVCIYENSLLINFDRLTLEDGKGLGESYNRIVLNKFNYKFGIIAEKDDLERIWQRSYDEAGYGFIAPQSVLNDIQMPYFAPNDNKSPQITKTKYLKYTVFYLNEQEIVLRLHNMAEFESLEIVNYQKKGERFQFEIEEIGLKLNAINIQESYANGIPLDTNNQWRKHWGKLEDEINIENQNSEDTDSILKLRPLQIRSFRANLGSNIEKDPTYSPPEPPAAAQTTADISQKIIDQPLILRRQRCF